MVKNMLQCCYTNLSKESGGKVVSGWQSVAVSDSIPPDAYRTCVGMQNQDSAIQGPMTDEHGNILNLLEICGDGKYLYMIRSQYGMLDRLGRPNMFSHAYIFPWTDDSVLIDPNAFLTIADSNFKSSKEDAEKPYGSLERLPEFWMWRALQSSGLTIVTAYLLIRCIYVQMTEKRISGPLYVLYDGSDLQMRSLLYCIYGLLPHHLRKTLRSACAGGVTERDKNVVFSVNALSQEYFFNPATGENSLLTDKLQKKIDRLGYIDYAAKHFIYWGARNHMSNLAEYIAENDVEADIRYYYKTLNGLAVSLGDATATNELFLKIANQLISNCQPPTFKDEDLRTDICDALRTGAYGSRSMEDYIYGMLNEICKRGLELALTDENKQNLLTWLNSPECKKLSAEKSRFQRVIKD